MRKIIALACLIIPALVRGNEAVDQKDDNPPLTRSTRAVLPENLKYKSVFLLKPWSSAPNGCLESSVYYLPSGDHPYSGNTQVVKMKLGKCYDTYAQQWQVTKSTNYGDGYFKLRSLVTGKCIQVGSYSDNFVGDNNTPVYQFTCVDSSPTQAFYQYKKFVFEGWPGYWYQFRDMGSNKCIYAPYDYDKELYVYECDDSIDQNQLWNFPIKEV